jgi:hypothetical protein
MFFKKVNYFKNYVAEYEDCSWRELEHYQPEQHIRPPGPAQQVEMNASSGFDSSIFQLNVPQRKRCKAYLKLRKTNCQEKKFLNY